jgi:G:T/U-mismatch repair DNA glycosylase
VSGQRSKNFNHKEIETEDSKTHATVEIVPAEMIERMKRFDKIKGIARERVSEVEEIIENAKGRSGKTRSKKLKYIKNEQVSEVLENIQKCLEEAVMEIEVLK